MKLKRYDKITLDRKRAVKLDSGMMRVPARISRVGVQDYRRADGSVERAYRPPEEVGKPASVASFDGRPLVNDHPYADGGVVNAENAKRLGVGFVMNPVFKDGFVEADLLIEDAEAVAAVESGKVELSAGYFIERDETPGVTPDGQRYDFVQRDITGNHVAIVDQGRAGADVRIQLDAAMSTDFQVIETDATRGAHSSPQTGKETQMHKIVIDGVEVEVSPLAATMIQKERAMASGLLDVQKAEVVKLTKTVSEKSAQCDALTEKVGKLEAELKDAPNKARAAIESRSALNTQAKAIAPDVKLDGLDDMGVKRAVCAAKGIKLDGKDDAYVNVRFDVLVEDHEKANPATEKAEAELKDPNRKVETDGAQTPAEAKKQMMREWANPTLAKK